MLGRVKLDNTLLTCDRHKMGWNLVAVMHFSLCYEMRRPSHPYKYSRCVFIRDCKYLLFHIISFKNVVFIENLAFWESFPMRKRWKTEAFKYASGCKFSRKNLEKIRWRSDPKVSNDQYGSWRLIACFVREEVTQMAVVSKKSLVHGCFHNEVGYYCYRHMIVAQDYLSWRMWRCFKVTITTPDSLNK